MLTVGMFLVDRYEILAKIGAGGMADVYKAKDHILGRVVAIKVLKPEFSEDVTFVTKFRTEAQSAAGLEHPNIVNIYDVGSENGLHFIVMEHIEGITLKTYIEKKGQLSFKEAASIAIQVARGIESAHNKEITHRDIKPQNIIISTEGKVKVTDFGIARASSSQTISADVMGSVHYASPEQARNGYVDGRSDIYSLGIVMYEMVTGRVPFDGDTAVAVALQHLQEEMVGPKIYAPELPISYEKIVLKCTQKNPDRRYQSIPDLLADLRKALVTPDEDFVVIAPLATATKTRIIGSDELEMIQDGAKDVDLDQETHFANEEVFEDEEEDLEDNYDDIDDEDDEEEDAGFLNPKLEKVLTIIGIVVFVLIVALSIFFVIRLVDIFSSGNKPNTENSQTESQIETNSNTDTNTETSTEDMVEMIDITGMTVEEAEDALKEWDIDLFIGATKPSDEEHGIILEQNVEEGELVEKGATITVVVSGESSSEQKVAVPKVINLHKDQAISELQKKNFVYKIEYEYSSEVEKDYVISQTPEYGESVKSGSRVTIVLSNGPENAKVPALSEFVGKTSADAKKLLENLGFKANVIEDWNSAKKGTVYDVPKAGQTLAYGSTVDVYISKGEAIYKVSYNFDENAPSEAVKYDCELAIKSNGTTKFRYQDEKAFNVITYTSNTEITNATITVTWYDANGDVISMVEDVALEIVKGAKTSNNIEKEPTFSGGRAPIEDSSEEDTTTGNQQDSQQPEGDKQDSQQPDDQQPGGGQQDVQQQNEQQEE